MRIRAADGTEVIRCSRGGHLLGRNHFYPSTWKTGAGNCRGCAKEVSRASAATYRATPKGQANQAKHRAIRKADPTKVEHDRKVEAARRATLPGYIAHLVKKHAEKNGPDHPVDYDAEWLLARFLEHPYCSVTGVELFAGDGGVALGFDMPWAPSFDRIDPSLPYAAQNLRTVSLIYNCALNDFSDEQLREAAAHLLGSAGYRLRAGESWVQSDSRPPRGAKGTICGYRAGMANKVDVRQGRVADDPVTAAWLRPRISSDALFGAPLVCPA
jgi:hypothetical protein